MAILEADSEASSMKRNLVKGLVAMGHVLADGQDEVSCERESNKWRSETAAQEQ